MLIVGHRGARHLAPENSLQAILAALDCAVDEIEIDVRLTADGVPVLHHDRFITLADVRLVPLANVSSLDLPENVPTLWSAITAVERRVPLYIEIKPGVPAQPVLDIIIQALTKGWQPADFKIASFDKRILHDAAKQLPDVPLVVNEAWSGIRAIMRAKRFGTPFIALNRRSLWSGFIRSATHRGYRVYTFTLNNPLQAEHWQRAGLYAVITDDPRLYR